MPMLDTSFVTYDPMLADFFDVRRRLNVMRDNGRVDAVPDELFLGVIGVVTQGDAAEIMRTEDGQTIPKRIFIASMFQFVAAATDYQGDEITWNKVCYRCKECLPYSRYGAGVYEAICEFQGNIPPAQ